MHVMHAMFSSSLLQNTCWHFLSGHMLCADPHCQAFISLHLTASLHNCTLLQCITAASPPHQLAEYCLFTRQGSFTQQHCMQCSHHCVSIHTSSCCKAWHWHDAGMRHAGHCDAGSHGDAPAASPQCITPAGGLPVRSCSVDGHALCCRRLSHPHPQQEVPWGKQPLVCV